MICTILVAGHGTLLEKELKSSRNEKYRHLQGIPKALLPGIDGKRILDYWWDLMKHRQLFSQVYLVTNADKYKHYERWATASDFPVENIINDGTTIETRSLGSVADFELCLSVKNILNGSNSSVLVIAGDMMFQDQKFDLRQLIEFHQSKNDGDLAMFYDLDPMENVSTRGVIEICPFSNKILKFYEKPKGNETNSRKASVVFYILRKCTLELISEYLDNCSKIEEKSFGRFMSWLINDKQKTVYGMKLPTGFQLIGQTSIKEYEDWLEIFNKKLNRQIELEKTTCRTYARVGIMGNPSDGFYGKTIAMSIKNFWADVTIFESEKLILLPHPLNDATEFGSLADLHGISAKEGYLGGLRLLQATCKKFYRYCSDHGIALRKRNFTLSYDTNIPRQVGLAGSSAIVTGTLKCLMKFFNLDDNDIPKEYQPQFILDVEVSELFINGGLQDRVVQVYEGLIYMDFSKELMDEQGFGNYEYLNTTSHDIPIFFIVYDKNPSDSGKIHSNVRGRFDSGDSEVIEAMKQFANYAELAKSAIMNSDWKALGDLMNHNFELRRKIYGDQCLGENNLKMVDIGRKHGASCKFPGSGGAILGLLENSDENLETIRKAYITQGFVFTPVIPNL